jgi:predicted nuclease of predicted toxin-antitoxin system
MNFLIDTCLPAAIVDNLRRAGHDAVHVRHYGIHKADDEIVFDRAVQEDRVVVSADTRFAMILTTRRASKPSIIVFRRIGSGRADALAKLLLANLPNIAELLNQGSIVVFDEARLRGRMLGSPLSKPAPENE